MEAGVVMNRALQLRAMDQLRQRLAEGADHASALPSAERLTRADAEQLRAMGDGRLGAVAVVALEASSLEPVIRLVQPNVRGTDLLVTYAADAVLVLAPGLDPLGGQSLTDRLQRLLQEQLATPLVVAAAYRSPLSLTGWRIAQLADDARRRALGAVEPVEAVEPAA